MILKKAVVSTAVLAIIISAQPAKADPPALGPLINLSNNPGVPSMPFEKVDQFGNIHVVWQDEETPNQEEIYYRRVNADGTLGSLLNVSQTSGESLLATRSSVGIDGSGNIHIVWSERTFDPNGDLYYRRVNNSGTLGPLVIVSENLRRFSEFLALDQAGNIHVGWMNIDGSGFSIFYRKINADGSINTVIDVTSGIRQGNPSGPTLLLDISGNVHVLWGDSSTGHQQIYYRKINFDGTFGSSITNISNTLGSVQGLSQEIDGMDNIHIVWYDNSSGNIETLYRKINADGSLGDQVNVSNNLGDSDITRSSLAVEGDELGGAHVIWADNSPGNIDLFYRRVFNNGSLGTQINLSQSTGESVFVHAFSLPAMGRDNTGNIHAVWSDSQQDDFDVKYRKIDTNDNPGQIRNLSNNIGNSQLPFLLVDSSGNAHVAWRNCKSPSGCNYHILYRVVRNPVGLSPILNFSEGLLTSSAYSIALSGSLTIHAVWHSLIINANPQPVDVFYRRTLAP